MCHHDDDGAYRRVLECHYKTNIHGNTKMNDKNAEIMEMPILLMAKWNSKPVCRWDDNRPFCGYRERINRPTTDENDVSSVMCQLRGDSGVKLGGKEFLMEFF